MIRPRWFRRSTVLATVGVVVVPLLMLAYLAAVPNRRGVLPVLLQAGVVVLGVVGFAILLARLAGQMNAGRVARWLETDEGKAWLADLDDAERAEFLDRLAEHR